MKHGRDLPIGYPPTEGTAGMHGRLHYRADFVMASIQAWRGVFRPRELDAGNCATK
jgi:hypothetical protein